MSQEMTFKEEKPRTIHAIPRWKKVLLGLSVVLMLTGVALRGYAWMQQPKADEAQTPQTVASTPAPGQSSTPAVARGFVSGAPRVEGPAADGEAPTADQPAGRPATELEVWSPVMMRLGFSFFAGFCIAYALRAFFKISILATGVALLLVMGLQYAGLVQVDWVAIDGRYQAATRWLTEQVSGFRQFVTGELPSAGTAAAGLLIGWRRK